MIRIILILALTIVSLLSLSSCASKVQFVEPIQPNTAVIQGNVDALKDFTGNYVSISEKFGFYDNVEDNHDNVVVGGMTLITDSFSGEEIIINSEIPIINEDGNISTKTVIGENGKKKEVPRKKKVLSEVIFLSKRNGKTISQTIEFIVAENDSLTKSYQIDFALRDTLKLLTYNSFHNNSYEVKRFNKNALVNKNKQIYVRKNGKIFYFFTAYNGKRIAVSKSELIKRAQLRDRYFFRILKFTDFNGEKEIKEIDSDILINEYGELYIKKNGKKAYVFRDSSGKIHTLPQKYKNVYLDKFYAQRSSKRNIKTYRAISKKLGE